MSVLVCFLAVAKNVTQLCANKKCEFMCIPTERLNKSLPIAVSCSCGDRMELNSDGRTCKASSVPVTTPNPVTKKPDATTQKPVTKHPDATTQKPQVITGGPGGYTVVPETNSTKQAATAGEKDPQSVGGIAAVAGGIAFVVILVAFVVSIFCVKDHFICYLMFSFEHIVHKVCMIIVKLNVFKASVKGTNCCRCCSKLLLCSTLALHWTFLFFSCTGRLFCCQKIQTKK